MGTIELYHVHKRYGSNNFALRDISLRINDGEFVTVIGPSGCGKTTLLRVVAGLEDITSGQLLFDGKLANYIEPQNRGVAMVFQDYSLFPNMSVYENIEFALKMRRVKASERREKVLGIAKTLEIEDLLESRPKGLSGGQAQRIAIGRALVCEPKLFLLDEPLSNLDLQMRERLKEKIAEIQSELKVTTLYVTHDQTEAVSLGDRVVVMSEGEIQQTDVPHNLFFRPANMFVAGFIGQEPMNFIRAACEFDPLGVRLVNPYFECVVPPFKGDVLSARGYLNKEVVVGIRPDSISFQKQNAGDCSVPITGAEICYTENWGHYQKVTLRLGKELIVAKYPGKAEDIDPLETLVFLDTERIHIFDKESGEAIVH